MGHAVPLVGCGEEDGVKYCKIQNSWGVDQDEGSFFRIVCGTNVSGIESTLGQTQRPIHEQPGAARCSTMENRGDENFDSFDSSRFSL